MTNSKRWIETPSVGRILPGGFSPKELSQPREIWWTRLLKICEDHQGDWIEITDPPFSRTTIQGYKAVVNKKPSGRHSSAPSVFYDPLFEVEFYSGKLYARLIKE